MSQEAPKQEKVHLTDEEISLKEAEIVNLNDEQEKLEEEIRALRADFLTYSSVAISKPDSDGKVYEWKQLESKRQAVVAKIIAVLESMDSLRQE